VCIGQIIDGHHLNGWMFPKQAKYLTANPSKTIKGYANFGFHVLG
jgi:hypothetical protein